MRQLFDDTREDLAESKRLLADLDVSCENKKKEWPGICAPLIRRCPTGMRRTGSHPGYRFRAEHPVQVVSVRYEVRDEAVQHARDKPSEVIL